MAVSTKQIEEFLSNSGVEFTACSEGQRDDVTQHWLQTYAQAVKRQTGEWIHQYYKWHGFSYEFEKAIAGAGAMAAYQAQWAALFYVFHEAGQYCYSCRGERYPDFSSFGDDIYVCHHNMKWTMVFTHEQPDIGPYFAPTSAAKPA